MHYWRVQISSVKVLVEPLVGPETKLVYLRDRMMCSTLGWMTSCLIELGWAGDLIWPDLTLTFGVGWKSAKPLALTRELDPTHWLISCIDWSVGYRNFGLLLHHWRPSGQNFCQKNQIWLISTSFFMLFAPSNLF